MYAVDACAWGMERSEAMSADSDPVLYKTADRVATVTLNRPDRLNAWTPDMAEQLRTALMRAEADPEIRAIVITGAGRGFCAGADMARLSSAAAGQGPLLAADESPTDGMAANFAQRLSYMLAIPKPIIAAINGPVAGIGFVLTLYCDIRFMIEGAKLTTAFARRGLIAEHGAAWILPRLVGPMNALDLLYSARPIPALDAEAMGLVRMLPIDGFREAVQTYAAEIANLSSPRAVGIIKRQVYEGMFQSLAEASVISVREQALCKDTEDFREGIAHFVEKRKPDFTGR
jgi:enoyl-CoA hydratase/carnithine racemase